MLTELNHSSDDGACLQQALSFIAAIDQKPFTKPKEQKSMVIDS